MKILIIGFSKTKYMPYLHFYLDNIDCERNDVHLLYWDRDGLADSFPTQKVTYHAFRALQQDEVPRHRKVLNFLRFRTFAKKLIRAENFDFLIVFLPIPALLLYRTLTKQYRDRFLFDFRDKTYEDFAPFHHAVEKIVSASRTTFISSDAFREFLPKLPKVLTTHNLQKSDLLHCEVGEKKEGAPLSIAFWGFIRQEEYNKSLIRAMNHDSRFELHYYGREQAIVQHLKNFCDEEKAENVFFHGEYAPEDRYDFAARTQLLNNLYDNASMQFAMSNKYYDGLLFSLPQICQKGSFMGAAAEKAGVGIMLDPTEPGFADELWNYYQSLDFDVFRENCARELARVRAEYDEAAAHLNF